MSDEDVDVVRTGLDGDEQAVRELLAPYFAEADERAQEHFGDVLPGLDVGAAVDADLDRLAAATVDEPLFLARDGERVVGCVQLKHLGESTAEVKRLYVEPGYRGQGLGRRLMEAVLSGAVADGYTTLRLGVAPYLERARALYEDLGFEYTQPYEQSRAPEQLHDEWCFMRLSMGER